MSAWLAVRISSYVCTLEVWRAPWKLELLLAAPCATLSFLSCSPNILRAYITPDINTPIINRSFSVAQRVIQRFPVTLLNPGFFKVSAAGVDFSVPFPRLLKDLPENIVLVTVRPEPCVLFTNVFLQAGRRASLYDLSEHLSCEVRECYVGSLYFSELSTSVRKITFL